ncbi:MAG: aminoacyl-tRNA hydrolase [Terriglobia bacterium]
MVESTSGLKLVAGLGNPGYEYYLTPHNLGFMAVDRLAEVCGVGITRPEEQALTGRARIGAADVILAKPQTFMNLSGLAVGRLLGKHEIRVEDLIVLVDDADLPFGSLRIRDRGSAGGHNGLKSVIGAAESDRFVRVRMGVQADGAAGDRAEYVLSRFRKADLESVADMVERAADAIMVMLRESIQTAMNRFNQ